jgi:hypothetical protein
MEVEVVLHVLLQSNGLDGGSGGGAGHLQPAGATGGNGTANQG